VPTVSALTGASAEHAEILLRTLAHGHLVYRTGPGRYALHELLRAYAGHVAAAEAEVVSSAASSVPASAGASTRAQATLAPNRGQAGQRAQPEESMYANALLALPR